MYHAGEKLVDKLDFEELALKSIDPSLGPTNPALKRGRLKDLGFSDELDHEKGRLRVCMLDPSIIPAITDIPKIPLLYPPSILSSSAVLAELLAYAEFRISKHRRGFYLWMSAAPLTAPFMLIRKIFTVHLFPSMTCCYSAIIPNIPFFFCAWRSWSHYRGVFDP